MASSETPIRKYMNEPDIKWRHEKPDYTVTDMKYLKGKTRSHKEDSLEKIVENLVKTWEMESSHKVDKKDWQTVDRENFAVSANGGRTFNLDDNINIGNYNMLMDSCPLYDAKSESNDSSHHLFRSCLPGGFPWELLDLYSGPPKVAFTWRHWGRWEGEYKGNKPNNEILEMFGSCFVTVTPDLKIQSIDVYYDPNPFLATLLNFDKKRLCPMHEKNKKKC